MLTAGEVVLRKQAVQKLKVIYMSANTVKRRIEEMDKDIENHVKKWYQIHHFIQFIFMNLRTKAARHFSVVLWRLSVKENYRKNYFT